jgi:hypothetical protein
MATDYGNDDKSPWQVAVRYLTLGVLTTGMVMVLWWLSRLADHLEVQRQLLVSIQRDVLVVQGNQTNILDTLGNDGRRLINVEERLGRAAEDRQQMRAEDRQMSEALLRLDVVLDQVREQVGAPPGNPGMTGGGAPGPKTRRR